MGKKKCFFGFDALFFSRERTHAHTMTTGSGRETLQAQWEHLQMKYVGTGHADMTK